MHFSEFVVKSRLGIHTGPAAFLARLASAFDSDINFKVGSRNVNGKSAIQILSLAVSRGQELTISADGSDSKVAISKIVEFLSANY